jgi:hypothetical protein
MRWTPATRRTLFFAFRAWWNKSLLGNMPQYEGDAKTEDYKAILLKCFSSGTLNNQGGLLSSLALFRFSWLIGFYRSRSKSAIFDVATLPMSGDIQCSTDRILFSNSDWFFWFSHEFSRSSIWWHDFSFWFLSTWKTLGDNAAAQNHLSDCGGCPRSRSRLSPSGWKRPWSAPSLELWKEPSSSITSSLCFLWPI